MPAYLSPEWMSRAADAIGEDEVLATAVRDADAGDGVTVVYVVQKAPESVADTNGQVVYSIHLSSRHGAVFSFPAATTPEATEQTVVLTLDYETAAAIHRGDLNPAAAMAMARVRVRGAAGKLVPLQDAFGKVPEVLGTLAAETTY